MPEVRLAWRASLCWYSRERQVLVGSAPVCEHRALLEAVGSGHVRRYRLPPLELAARRPRCAGYGTAPHVFGIVPLWPDDGDPIEGRDVMLTLKLDTDRGRMRYLRGAARAAAHIHRPFVVAVGFPRYQEVALFAKLAAADAGTLHDLCRHVAAERAAAESGD